MERFGRIGGIGPFIRTHGLRDFFREIHFRASTRYWEHRFAVQTVGRLSVEDLGFSGPDDHEYNAIPYRGLFEALRGVPIRSFLDIGCGKGRPLLVAAHLGAQRVRGIDLSAALCERARANLKGLSVPWEVIHGNAADYVIPHDVDVIYMGHPVQGPTLTAVMQRIRDSQAQYLVYFASRVFDQLHNAGKFPWLVRIHAGTYYPHDFPYSIFHITPA